MKLLTKFNLIRLVQPDATEPNRMRLSLVKAPALLEWAVEYRR